MCLWKIEKEVTDSPPQVFLHIIIMLHFVLEDSKRGHMFSAAGAFFVFQIYTGIMFLTEDHEGGYIFSAAGDIFTIDTQQSSFLFELCASEGGPDYRCVVRVVFRKVGPYLK